MGGYWELSTSGKVFLGGMAAWAAREWMKPTVTKPTRAQLREQQRYEVDTAASASPYGQLLLRQITQTKLYQWELNRGLDEDDIFRKYNLYTFFEREDICALPMCTRLERVRDYFQMWSDYYVRCGMLT